MSWFRSRNDTSIVQELRRRIAQMRRQIDVHEQQISRLERSTQATAQQEPLRGRLDAYLGQVLPVLLLGVVGGAIAVVCLFTVDDRRMQAIVMGVLAAGMVALVAVHRVSRRLNAEGETAATQSRDQATALGLYVVGVICFVASIILVAWN